MEYKIDNVKMLASKFGWKLLCYQPMTQMISFKKCKDRINIYYTTRTVATIVDHPVQGRNQMFRKNVSYAELEKIFLYPREHTNKGYRYTKSVHYRKKRLERRQIIRKNRKEKLPFKQKLKNKLRKICLKLLS